MSIFVATSNSVHTARWLKQTSNKGWDIHLLRSTYLFSYS